MSLSKEDLKLVIDDLAPIFTMDGEAERLGILRDKLANLGVSSIADLREAARSSSKTEMTRRHYDNIFSKMRGESWFVFMNHGYAPSESETNSFPKLQAEDEKWRHQVFLYFYLMNSARSLSRSITPRACDLLDVGCGRGGGLSAAKRYYGLRKAVGVDLNFQQIAFCTDQHQGIGLEFVQGSALAMPFEDGSFHLVSNVESSHSYGDVSAFLREVRRILKSGGLFLLADLREKSFEAPIFEVELLSSGLKPLFKEDITEKVRQACVSDVERFRTVFGSEKAEFPRDIAARMKDVYASGTTSYLAYVLEKTA